MKEQLPRVFRIAAQEHKKRQAYKPECRHLNPLLIALKHFQRLTIIVCVYNENRSNNKYDVFGFYHLFRVSTWV
jgi:hypothetical protein